MVGLPVCARTITIKMVVPMVYEIRTILHLHLAARLYSSRGNLHCPPEKLLSTTAKPDDDLTPFATWCIHGDGQRNTHHSTLHRTQIDILLGNLHSGLAARNADVYFSRRIRTIGHPEANGGGATLTNIARHLAQGLWHPAGRGDFAIAVFARQQSLQDSPDHLN
jgi:hypothetical protein